MTGGCLVILHLEIQMMQINWGLFQYKYAILPVSYHLIFTIGNTFTKKDGPGCSVIYMKSAMVLLLDFTHPNIFLNFSDKARERVMREVKALAKLDNGGIVRYYQAWFESPPPGWQEERDRNSLDTESVTNTPMISSTGFRSKHPTPKHSPLHSSVKSPTILNFNQRNPFKLDSSFDHSKPFGGAGDSTMESDSEWAKSQNGRKGGSDGFLPRLQHSVDDSVTRSESGSFSEQSLHLQPPEDSLSVNFVDSSVSKSRSVHVPFTLYDKSDSNQRTSNLLDWDYENSVSVIFEDSGCAEKSTTEELSLSSSTSNCDVPQNVVMMEQGVRRSKSKSRSRSHRRSKSCDSVSSRKLGKSKLSKSFDDTWTMSKHKPPDNLDIFTTRDEINKKDTVAPTPTRKLYLYIQMQLCQRATLKDWMIQNSEHREPATLLDILDQIVCAVDYIHSTGLMHRDLKVSKLIIVCFIMVYFSSGHLRLDEVLFDFQLSFFLTFQLTIIHH